MSINNNEITIKYFYDNGKLYRLVYQIDDDVASAMPTSQKDTLQSSIQEAVNKTLSDNSSKIDSIKWSPTNLSGDLQGLDATLTSEINKVSRMAARTFFDASTATSKAAPSSVTVSPGITSIEAFCSSLCVKYLNPTEKAAIDAEDELDDKMALLAGELVKKRDPQIFDKIAKDFSEFLKQPQAIKEICPKNLGKVLSLVAVIHSPKLLTPQDALLAIQPYLANNQEFKDNLKLFVKVTSDLLTAKDDLEEDPNALCKDALTDPIRLDPDQAFNALYHVSPSSRVFQLHKFYANLESFIERPKIKTALTISALRPEIHDKTTSVWAPMSDAVRNQVITPVDFTQATGELKPAFDHRLATKIEELKKLISSDVEGLSFTLECVEADNRIIAHEIKPDMSLDETERHEQIKGQLKEFFELLDANYNLQDQVKILHCMTQKMVTASSHAIAFANRKVGHATKVLHQGMTVGFERQSKKIIIMTQTKSLATVPENIDGDILKTQDLVTTQNMALFNANSVNRDHACGYSFGTKQYKEPLTTDLFSSNNTRLSLM